MWAIYKKSVSGAIFLKFFWLNKSNSLYDVRFFCSGAYKNPLFALFICPFSFPLRKWGPHYAEKWNAGRIKLLVNPVLYAPCLHYFVNEDAFVCERAYKIANLMLLIRPRLFRIYENVVTLFVM